AVILAVDGLLALVFLGGLVALGTMRWATPPLAEVRDTGKLRKQAPKPPAPAEGEKPPEPPKSEAKAEPKPAPAPKAEAPAPKDRPTGSPSVHATPLPQRRAEPVGAGEEKPRASAKAGAAAAPESKPRALSVEFSHSDSSAREVFLKGPFLVRSGGKKAMARDATGVWRLSISLLPGDYRYSFIVDGKRTATQTMKVE
ncbi:MAG: hypothetical protein HY554_05905, partial [Elusimicrobia bacterium]|nr:hypothetical protein [Elusimicrobiota bacterium]